MSCRGCKNKNKDKSKEILRAEFNNTSKVSLIVTIFSVLFIIYGVYSMFKIFFNE